MIALSSLTVEEALRLKGPETELEKRLVVAVEEEFTALERDFEREVADLRKSSNYYCSEFCRLQNVLEQLLQLYELPSEARQLIQYNIDLR